MSPEIPLPEDKDKIPPIPPNPRILRISRRPLTPAHYADVLKWGLGTIIYQIPDPMTSYDQREEAVEQVIKAIERLKAAGFKPNLLDVGNIYLLLGLRNHGVEIPIVSPCFAVEGGKLVFHHYQSQDELVAMVDEAYRQAMEGNFDKENLAGYSR